MNHGLAETTVERIRQVLAHYPEVETGVLYGSRATGTHRPGSDIDPVLMAAGRGGVEGGCILREYLLTSGRIEGVGIIPSTAC